MKPNLKKEQKIVDNWNANVPVGTMVEYCETVGYGDPWKPYKTRSQAQILGGHTAVVWLEGKSGCVKIDGHCRVAASEARNA